MTLCGQFRHAQCGDVCFLFRIEKHRRVGGVLGTCQDLCQFLLLLLDIFRRGDLLFVIFDITLYIFGKHIQILRDLFMCIVVCDELLEEPLQLVPFGALDIEGFLNIAEMEIVEAFHLRIVSDVFSEKTFGFLRIIVDGDDGFAGIQNVCVLFST